MKAKTEMIPNKPTKTTTEAATAAAAKVATATTTITATTKSIMKRVERPNRQQWIKKEEITHEAGMRYSMNKNTLHLLLIYRSQSGMAWLMEPNSFSKFHVLSLLHLY